MYLDTETMTLLRYRPAAKHTFLSILISVFRRYETLTKKVLAQSEKIRYGFGIPMYLPSVTSDV